MEEKLKTLFQFQRFSPNKRLDEMIADVKKRYQQLSDADLEMVAAAGEVSLPILITGDTDNGKL